MKDERVYLGHIRDAINDIEEYASVGRDAFMAERMRQDAVIRKLEIIGEAVKQLSVTDHLPAGDEYTNVPCRRSPGRRRCRGEIVALLNRSSGYIEWHCPLCGDNGLIHGWDDTPWDRQHETRAVPTIPSPTTAH